MSRLIEVGTAILPSSNPLSVAESLPLDLHIFERFEDLCDETELIYHARHVNIHLQVTASNRIGFTLWGMPQPINCQFQIVPDPVAGEEYNLTKCEFDIPVWRGCIPTRMAAFDFDTYAALLVPLTTAAKPFSPIQRLDMAPMSQTEVNAEKLVLRENHHLIYIDLKPRRHTDPTRRRTAGTLMNTLLKAA